MGRCAVKKRPPKLLSDWFGEVVIWSDNDILVVPRDIEDSDSRNDKNAVYISYATMLRIVEIGPSYSKGKQNRASPDLFPKLCSYAGLISPPMCLLDGLPCS